jgi:hypothetical protein
MRELRYEAPVKIRKLIHPRFSLMAKEPIQSLNNDFERKQLEKHIAELEKQLKEVEMKAISFSTMVDIAEKEFKIPIRKKYNTKS